MVMEWLEVAEDTDRLDVRIWTASRWMSLQTD